MLTKKTIAIGALALVASCSAGGALFAERGAVRTHDVPATGIAATDAPEVIERGRYLVHGPMHCTSCHVADWGEAMRAGAGIELELAGGRTWDIPGLVVFRAPNLTSDPETGIGAKSDEHIARVLRYGVGEDGRLSPMMSMTVGEVSDEDLTAIVSYLRSLKPVRNEVALGELRLGGKLMVAAGLAAPRSGDVPEHVASDSEPTVARGAYLANGPANCRGCHSPFQGPELVGEPFSGGVPHPATDAPDEEVCAPNLTPDAETGRITNWTEDAFVARMKAGYTDPRTYMAWGNYAYMSDVDLRSIYRYLQSLPPVRRDVGPSFRTKGWSPE